MTLTNNEQDHQLHTPAVHPHSPQHPRSAEVPTPGRKRGKLVALFVVGLAVALVLAAVAAWYLLIREVAPAEVNSLEAAAARSEATSDAAPATDVNAGISGTWNVDTSIGQFNDACLTGACSSTFAGFRIDEVLSGIGDKTVVGRTPGVSGQITIDGTLVTGGEFTVDMTGLITDSGARTAALQSQAIETSSFPTATFRLTAPIDLGRAPEPGEQVSVVATGDLTVHGVTRSVQLPLFAEHQNGVMVVFGQAELALADFGISAPSAPIVVSVEDTAILELQFFLTR